MHGRVVNQLVRFAAVVLAVCLARGATAANEPFSLAGQAPADVSMYVEAERPAALWKEIEGKPIAAWVKSVLLTDAVRQSWKSVADQADAPDEALFDALFARRCVLMTRRTIDGVEWAVVLEVDRARALAVLRQLRPRQLAPRHGVAVMAIPEQDVLAAVEGDRCVIAPRTRPGLFDDVLAGLSGDRTAEVLAMSEPVKGLVATLRGEERMGDARISAIIRHDRPLGGATAITAAFRDGEAALRVESSFENPPFARGLTSLRWDCSKIDVFDRSGLVTVIEPTDIGPGSFEQFAQSVLNRPIISRDMRKNLADTQILTIGEAEGRTESPPSDMLTPTAALALRMKDPLRAEAVLDEQIVELTRSINALGQGSYLVELPDRSRFEPGGMRHLGLESAMNELGRGFPIMSSISLNWCVAQTPSGSYYVIATHPEQLEEMRAALRRLEETGGDVGRWANCGLLHGPRLAQHLRSLAEQAPRFTDPARPEDAEAFRSTLDLLALLGDGLERARWKMERPSRERMRLEIELDLRQPATERR